MIGRRRNRRGAKMRKIVRTYWDNSPTGFEYLYDELECGHRLLVRTKYNKRGQRVVDNAYGRGRIRRVCSECSAEARRTGREQAKAST